MERCDRHNWKILGISEGKTNEILDYRFDTEYIWCNTCGLLKIKDARRNASMKYFYPKKGCYLQKHKWKNTNVRVDRIVNNVHKRITYQWCSLCGILKVTGDVKTKFIYPEINHSKNPYEIKKLSKYEWLLKM